MLTHDVFYNREHSGKEELDSYLPKYWRDIREMEANNTFAGYTLDRMAADMEKTVKDRFFDSCSEAMLARYEAFLHITPAQETSSEDRRSIVKMKWNSGGKMTGRRIRAIVKECCGADCEVFFGASQMVIDMTFRDDPAGYMAMIREAITNSTIPAHIEIIFKGNVDLSIIFLWDGEIDIPRINLRMDFSMYYASAYFDGFAQWDGTQGFNGAYAWFPVRCQVPALLETKEKYAVGMITPVVVKEQLNIDNNVLFCSDNICSVETAVSLFNTLDTEHTENIEASVEIRKNLRYFDGSVCWDGSVLMNSNIKKEEL